MAANLSMLKGNRKPESISDLRSASHFWKALEYVYKFTFWNYCAGKQRSYSIKMEFLHLLSGTGSKMDFLNTLTGKQTSMEQ